MSTAQIIAELPRLSDSDRRLIRIKLLELEEQNEDVSACNYVAAEGAKLLDSMENEDASLEER